MALKKIYANAEEKFVPSVVLYGKSNKLYTDEKTTEEIDHDEALNLCMKNLAIVFLTDTYYTVSSFADSDGTLTITTSDDTEYTVTAAE